MEGCNVTENQYYEVMKNVQKMLAVIIKETLLK